MTHFIKNIYSLITLGLCCLGLQSQAQVTANCYHSISVDLSPNGVATINAADIDSSSTGFIDGIYPSNSPIFTPAQTLPVDCNYLGNNIVILSVIDTTVGGASAVCSTQVVVNDPFGTCSSTGSLIFTDSVNIDASSCNTCDGEAIVGLLDPNSATGFSNANPPYTFTWSDGMTFTSNNNAVHSRNDLCTGTHTVTLFDATQTQYTLTLQVACNQAGTGNNLVLTDSFSVDASNCSTCDGITYIYLEDANNPTGIQNTSAPYTFQWSDGVVNSTTIAYDQRNDLCPNQPYVVTMTDNAGMQYVYTSLVACNGGGTGANPVNVVCNTTTLYLNPNGIANLDAQTFGAGSTGDIWTIIGGNTSAGTGNGSTAQFDCSHLGANWVTLAVSDSTGNSVDTCSAYVYIVDNNNYCNGGSNAPIAVCQDITVNLDTNGMATIYPQDIDGGSTGNALYIFSANSTVAGTWNNSLDFDCTDLNVPQQVVLVVQGSNQQIDTCSANITITDPLGVCNGTGGGTYAVIDSFTTDASNCSTCDGQYSIGSLVSAGVSIPFPSTNHVVVWNDGVLGSFRNDLCPNQAYSFAVYDNNQNNLVQHSLIVGCNSGTNCIDPSTIDTTVVCPTVLQPVCGCDGVTYNNSCEAENWYGVTSWTTGACGSSSNIIVTQNVVGSSCDTNTCSGYAILTATGGSAPYSFLWSDGYQGANHQNLCAGVYTVTVSDTAGSSTVATVLIGTNQGCVWPGDTDDNTVVNNYDLLPIAIAFGALGTARAVADRGINWTGYNATDWAIANASLPFDYKHVDADGDGAIGVGDVSAILQNYGQNYYRSSNPLSGTLPIYMDDISTDEGERISLPIMLGTANNVATDVYGIAFTINYDPGMIEAGSVGIDIDSSWLGSDLLEVSKDFSTTGAIEVAIARKDHVNINGFGQIATLNLTIIEDIIRAAPDSITTKLSISNVRITDNMYNQEGAITDQITTITISELTNSVTPNPVNAFEVAVFPNPSKDLIHVQTQDAVLEELRLYNTAGQLLTTQLLSQEQQSILNVSDLASGIYILNIITDKGMQTKRVQVSK